MKFHHTASVVLVGILGVAMAAAGVKADSLRMMVQSVPEAGAKCLDAHDLVPGTGMRIWGCNNTVAQILSYDETSRELKIGGLCVESRGRGDPQDAVGLGNCNGGANQHWQMVASGGNYRIVGGNGLCVAIKGADTADGAPLNIENCQDRANQLWSLVQAPAVVVDAPAVGASSGSATHLPPTTGQSQAAKTEGQPNSNPAPAQPASNSAGADQHTASLTPSDQHVSRSQTTTRRSSRSGRSSRSARSRAKAQSASSSPPAQTQSQGGGVGFGIGIGGFGFGHRSDVRLKEDIVPLGWLGNGIGLYRFRYKGDDHTVYVGVMAQEVRKVAPRAVSRDRDGFLRVDYDRLGIRFMTWNDYVAGNSQETPDRSRLAVRARREFAAP